MWRKENPTTLLVGMEIAAGPINNTVWDSQKLQIEFPYSNPTPRHTAGQNDHSKRNMHPYVHRNMLQISETDKQHDCPLEHAWIKKMRYICTTEY